MAPSKLSSSAFPCRVAPTSAGKRVRGRPRSGRRSEKVRPASHQLSPLVRPFEKKCHHPPRKWHNYVDSTWLLSLSSHECDAPTRPVRPRRAAPRSTTTRGAMMVVATAAAGSNDSHTLDRLWWLLAMHRGATRRGGATNITQATGGRWPSFFFCRMVGDVSLLPRGAAHVRDASSVTNKHDLESVQRKICPVSGRTL